MTRPRTLPALAERHREERRRLVAGALERHGWSLSAAARQLGVPYSTLQKIVETHGLGEAYAEHAPGRVGRPKSG